jgi:hypothetical protein
MKLLTSDEPKYKELRVISYLLLSGILGYLSATYIVGNEMLSIIFAPTINYILYVLTTEIKENQEKK